MEILEIEDFLTDDEVGFITHGIGNIPWFYQHSSYGEFIEVEGKKISFEEGTGIKFDPKPFFGHSIIERWKEFGQPQVINSEYFPIFLNIFERFIKTNNLSYNNILRMSLNLTIGGVGEFTVPFHVDHDIPHKQCLMYLSDCSGSTLFLENKWKEGPMHYRPTNEEINNGVEVIPKKGKVIGVDGTHYHSVRTSKADELRFICVVTYD